MIREPAEHDRKKAQTREAKRQGWQRQQRPEYPPRMRHTPQELVPTWERREVGVQGAREPQGVPESFLERVRTRAGRDLRKAESWGDLERRLEGC